MEFMNSAVDSTNAKYQQNLLRSLMHPHANHSLRMWLSLLIALGSHGDENVALTFAGVTPFNQLMHVVQKNAVELAMDDRGVRMVNLVLTKCPSNPLVGPLLDKLLGSPSILHSLLIHRMANHAIKLAVCIEKERIFRSVVLHFATVARDEFGHHVVKKCVQIASSTWLACFTEAFIKHKVELVAEPKYSKSVRRALADSLSKNGLSSLVVKLNDSLSSLPMLLSY